MKQLKLIIRNIQWIRQTGKAASRSSFSILYDFLLLHKTALVSKKEYTNYQFYNADKSFRDSFLSMGRAWQLWDVLNPKNYACLARDKYLSHCLLRNLQIPKSDLYIYYNPQLATNTEKLAFNYDGVVSIIKKLNIKQCVIKPSQDSAHGQGVVVCNDIEILDNKCLIKKYDGEIVELKNILREQPLLFESIVKQNHQFASFNQSSVNTVRMMTALYPNNEVKVIASFIKIGRAGSCVDNAGSGGNVDCAIDITSGRLYNVLEFNSWEDIKSITHHPDSKTQIEGCYIENWEAIVKQVCDYQARIPQLKVIGWDIAITDDGPIVIEINNWWDTTGQLFLNRGWKPEVMDCYNAWVKYNNTKNK